MTYSMKLDVDGWKLAVLIQELALEAERIACDPERLDSARRVRLAGVVRALKELSGCLPVEADQEYTLKLDLGPVELHVLQDVVASAARREGGSGDDLGAVLRSLQEDIDGYLWAVAEVRRLREGGDPA